MPKRPNFTPILTDQGWMVSIPPTLSGSGKRERHFYGVDEQAAKKAAGKLRTQYANGQRGGIISHDLAVMAAKAQKLLDPLNMTILEAAQDVVRRYDADGNNESFKDRLSPSSKTRPVKVKPLAALPDAIHNGFWQQFA